MSQISQALIQDRQLLQPINFWQAIKDVYSSRGLEPTEDYKQMHLDNLQSLGE